MSQSEGLLNSVDTPPRFLWNPESSYHSPVNERYSNDKAQRARIRLLISAVRESFGHVGVSEDESAPRVSRDQGLLRFRRRDSRGAGVE